jgi:LPPG:FO 2-phospho-L-lactate transferase
VARYLALTGGVGGAKLALGLRHVLPPEALTFAVNVGDDFEHLGLHVAPDLDTLMYTLAGLSNPETGWGRAGETWHFIETLRALGGEDWFNLGDRDLAVHVRRTCLLREGLGLAAVTAQLYGAVGIAHRALPVTDDPVRTQIETDAGPRAFQHYFVRERCAPRVRGFHYAGAAAARPLPALLEVLAAPDLAGVIICPSNPFLSIDPMLAIPGLRAALAACAAPVVAVSPIVAGQALKGPTAKIMAELGLACDAAAIAAHYRPLIQGFILDDSDRALEPRIARDGLAVTTAQSVMATLDDRINLAHTALEFLRSL